MENASTVVTSKNIHNEQLRYALNKSISNIYFNTVKDVENYFGKPLVGSLTNVLYEKLKSLLISNVQTNFDTHDLRAVAFAQALEHSASLKQQPFEDVFAAILPCISSGTQLKLPVEECWVEALTIGRALLTLKVYFHIDNRQDSVTKAAQRLTTLGYILHPVELVLDRTSPVFNEITAAVCQRFERLGLANVLIRLFEMARQKAIHNFDQYLFGYNYSYSSRDPNIPFGFLFNLAVRTTDKDISSENPECDWREVIEISRDLVSIINVEPYNKFWMTNTHPKRLETLLNDVGLYDHLFGIRQWPIFVTPLLIKSFFGTNFDALMTARIGWNVSDAVRLCEALINVTATDPIKVKSSDLLSTGLSSEILGRMLSQFSHPLGEVNQHYHSPLSAKSADMMFRPLIKGANDTYFAPAASTIGPACYEVVSSALRTILDSNEISSLVGNGTERAVIALLKSFSFIPSFEGAKYNEGKAKDSGECDIVLEDSQEILLIECKGKPLTRATMGGETAAALLDYAGGVIASQVQALQHERILHQNGEIVFDDNRKLVHNGRRITRLSITLLDLGSLQDRSLFLNLINPFLRSTVEFTPDHPKKKQLRDLNNELDRLRNEMANAELRSGSVWQETLGAASLNFGQLASILFNGSTLSTLVERLRKPVTYGTMNPLLEFHHAKNQGLL